MYRIFLSILGFISLFLLVTGSFSASGDVHPEPQVTPDAIQFTKTETTTGEKIEEQRSPKVFIKKRFQPQEAYIDNNLLRFVSRTTPLSDK